MAKIKAATPVVRSATPEETFPDYWMKEFHCQSNPNGKTSVRAMLVACRDDVDGEGNPVKRLGGSREQIVVADVFARIAADPTSKLAVAFDAVIAAIIEESDVFEAEVV